MPERVKLAVKLELALGSWQLDWRQREKRNWEMTKRNWASSREEKTENVEESRKERVVETREEENVHVPRELKSEKTSAMAHNCVQQVLPQQQQKKRSRCNGSREIPHGQKEKNHRRRKKKKLLLRTQKLHRKHHHHGPETHRRLVKDKHSAWQQKLLLAIRTVLRCYF
jgi:hypothetical protein